MLFTQNGGQEASNGIILKAQPEIISRVADAMRKARQAHSVSNYQEGMVSVTLLLGIRLISTG